MKNINFFHAISILQIIIVIVYAAFMLLILSRENKMPLQIIRVYDTDTIRYVKIPYEFLDRN